MNIVATPHGDAENSVALWTVGGLQPGAGDVRLCKRKNRGRDAYTPVYGYHADWNTSSRTPLQPGHFYACREQFTGFDGRTDATMWPDHMTVYANGGLGAHPLVLVVEKRHVELQTATIFAVARYSTMYDVGKDRTVVTVEPVKASGVSGSSMGLPDEYQSALVNYLQTVPPGRSSQSGTVDVEFASGYNDYTWPKSPGRGM